MSHTYTQSKTTEGSKTAMQSDNASDLYKRRC